MGTTLHHQSVQWSEISSGYAFDLKSYLPTHAQQELWTGHQQLHKPTSCGPDPITGQLTPCLDAA